MSSILRALKKLDEDSLDQGNQTGEQKVKMRRVVHRRAKMSLSVSRALSLVTVLLLFVIAVGITWLLLNSKPEPPVPREQDSKSQESQMAPVTKTRTQPRQPDAIVKKEEPEPLKASESIKAPASKEKTGTVKTPIQYSQEVVEKKQMRPQLILNGVLWAETPGKRVALINGRYVKEGEKIDGVSVKRIEKKSVTLQSGEETWTIQLKK